MGRRGVAKKKTRKGGGASFPSAAGGGGGAGGRVPTDPSLLQADPSRIRFQYSRIRPVFSGCGRSVQATLDDIREGRLLPSDLPPIQVLAGPAAEGGQWYFSLNNRRLWVLKRCREEGLLGPGNTIGVRLREPRSHKEAERYTLQNCALEAKFVREKIPAEQQEPRPEGGYSAKGGRGGEGLSSLRNSDYAAAAAAAAAGGTSRSDTAGTGDDHEDHQIAEKMTAASLSYDGGVQVGERANTDREGLVGEAEDASLGRLGSSDSDPEGEHSSRLANRFDLGAFKSESESESESESQSQSD